MAVEATMDSHLIDMMSAVFSKYRQQKTAAQLADWDRDLWAELDGLGLANLTGSEVGGGSGAGWGEAAQLLRAAARNGVRVPLAEHDLLATWLLEEVELPLNGLRRTAALVDDAGDALNVPWAGKAERIAVVYRVDGGYRIADVAPNRAKIAAGFNLAGEPRDTISVDLADLDGVEIDSHKIRQFFLRGALARAVQTSAVLDEILDMSVAHTVSRTQFGRPLSKFQAVQHLVSDIAAEAGLARAATEAALSVAIESGWHNPRLEFAIAVARSTVGHAASVVVRNSHQVHGAMGTTLEHRLHEFTRPALAWRSEFGSLDYWDQTLTDLAVSAGEDGLWGLITG